MLRFIREFYQRYVLRWFRVDDRLLLIFAGSIAGICSGLAAVGLRIGLETAIEYLHHFRHYAWAFVLPGIGALLSSLFLDKVTREGAGHGVPEVIYAVSRRGGLLRLRSSFSRLISSFLTIASGGSAGPEAPVVMSGSSIGSNVAKLLTLNDRQRITLVGCGTAGAIAAIFNAPMAGMVFAIEVILGEWKFVNIIPIAIAAVAGAQVSQAIIPEQVLFSHTPFHMTTADVPASIGLAILAALISVSFTRLLRLVGGLGKKAPLPLWAKAIVGGCTVGLIGVVMPLVLSEGYHFIQSMIAGDFSMALIPVFVAIFAKIFATALTLGWGGSGGIFAPCLLIGSLTGVLFHTGLTLVAPEFGGAGQGAYALLGMTGLVSGVMQAPLTGIFLIVEITGGYEIILLLILVSSISSTLSHYIEPASFYFKELIERGELMRPGTDARILSDLSLRELVDTDYRTVSENMVFKDFIDLIKNTEQNYFPVVEDDTQHYRGMIKISAIRQYALEPALYPMVFLNQVMDTQMPTVDLDDELGRVLDLMDASHSEAICVTDHDRFIGMINKSRVLDLYRRELIMQTNIQ